jgi:hypothetical protein
LPEVKAQAHATQKVRRRCPISTRKKINLDIRITNQSHLPAPASREHFSDPKATPFNNKVTQKMGGWTQRARASQVRLQLNKGLNCAK